MSKKLLTIASIILSLSIFNSSYTAKKCSKMSQNLYTATDIYSWAKMINNMESTCNIDILSNAVAAAIKKYSEARGSNASVTLLSLLSINITSNIHTNGSHCMSFIDDLWNVVVDSMDHLIEVEGKQLI